MDQRNRFENWCSIMGYNTVRNEDGYYEAKTMNHYWAVWMASVEHVDLSEESN